MKVIGLIGGIASGKSLVARMLVELGAGLLDADRTGHDLLAEDPEVRRALCERWGEGVLTANGQIDRSAVARRVFGGDGASKQELEFLEDVLHPRIRARLEEEARGFAAQQRPAVVLDAPLLLEAGWGPMCNVVLMVDSTRETRLTRARARGWTEAEFDKREAAQWPIVKKRGAADFVINNDGSADDLHTAVQAFWDQHIQ